ncbi:MAG: arginase family protein [Candidatus Dormibacteraeota bacterium]|nr:arginase family protein [Candidatus Dormibacteraeota bacterium]
MSQFELVGAPTSAGAHGPGQEKAPAALRRAGLIEALRSANVDLDDAGDLPIALFHPDPANRRAQNASRVASVATQVADQVVAVVRRGHLPFVIGGDCTITIGVVSGLLDSGSADLGVLYFDGDIDLNSPETTRSGILDNMGIAHLIGMAGTPLQDVGPRRPLLTDGQIVLFGYETDEQEVIQRSALKRRAIRHHPADEVRGNPSGIAREAMAELTKHAKRVLVHFDVDVIDTTELPLADFPHFNAGLSLEDAMACLKVFLSTPALAGVVMTEINPDHDPDGTILRDFVHRVAAAFRQS